MPSISGIIYVTENTYINSITATESPARKSLAIVNSGYNSSETDRIRPLFKFYATESSIPKYAQVTSAVLNLRGSKNGTQIIYDIYGWPSERTALDYDHVAFGCSYMIDGLCFGFINWSGGFPVIPIPGHSDMIAKDIQLTLPAASNTSSNTSISSDFASLIQNRTLRGNRYEIMLRKVNETSSGITRSIHALLATTESHRPNIAFTYYINEMLVSPTEITKNLGGLGEVRFAKNSSSDNNMPIIIGVTGSRSISDPTFIGGTPIMTSMYGEHRALHVYLNPDAGSTARSGIRTVYGGIPLQMTSTNSSDFYICTAKEEGTFDSSTQNTGKQLKLGNLFITNDSSGRVLVFEKTGSPIETSKIYIGGNPVTVGRFSDGWALGIDY